MTIDDPEAPLTDISTVGQRAGRATTDAQPTAPRVRALAFYLPQYSPNRYNDEWWGKGFTEWRLVTRAQPKYPGHYQPRLPGELGFYDLRVDDVRKRQTELARAAGIEGFCMFHYWFGGERLLDEVEQQIADDPSVDFPFCLCWANENWRRNWDGRTGTILMEQTHSDDDDLAHYDAVRHLLLDPRSIKVHDRPVFVVYRPVNMPSNGQRFVDNWTQRAAFHGDPVPWFIAVAQHGEPNPTEAGFDGWTTHVNLPEGEQNAKLEPNGWDDRFVDYESVIERNRSFRATDPRRNPTVVVDFDNSARRPQRASIIRGATTRRFEDWLRSEADDVEGSTDRFVFIAAWNEWGEACYVEPDDRFGRATLDACSAVLVTRPSQVAATTYPAAADLGSSYDCVGAILKRLAMPEVLVVDLGAGGGASAQLAEAMNFAYVAFDLDPDAVQSMRSRDIDARELDLSNQPDLLNALESLPDDRPVVFLLLDVLEHLVEPQEVLLTLRAWATEHDCSLITSIPNITHADVLATLKRGRFPYFRNGLLDATHLRFFDSASSHRLLETTGWLQTCRSDFLANTLDPTAVGRADRLAFADAHPDAAVVNFIQGSVPIPGFIVPARLSFLDAVGAGQLVPSVHTQPFLSPMRQPGSGNDMTSIRGTLAEHFATLLTSHFPRELADRLGALLVTVYFDRSDVRGEVGWLDTGGSVRLIRWAATYGQADIARAYGSEHAEANAALKVALSDIVLSQLPEPDAPQLSRKAVDLWLTRDDLFGAFDITSQSGYWAFNEWVATNEPTLVLTHNVPPSIDTPMAVQATAVHAEDSPSSLATKLKRARLRG